MITRTPIAPETPEPAEKAPERTLNARVPDDAAGRRFDQVLADLFPDFSRSRLAAWIKAGAARLDGAEVLPRHIVHGGESIAVDVRAEREIGAAAEDIPLDIRYEDADVIVVDKPAGLVVHPGAGNPAGTLQNALLHHDPKLAEIPRGGIVHRLDKDTSGLMVVARSMRARSCPMPTRRATFAKCLAGFSSRSS